MSRPIESNALLPFLAEAYGLDNVESVELVSQACNDTYRVDVGAERLLLRLYGPNDYMNIRPDEYRFELEYLDYVSKRGCPVAAPIPLKDGQFLARFESPAAQRDAALFRFAPGRPHAAWWPEVDETAVPKVGAILAQLHLEAATFSSRYPRHHFDLHLLLEEPLRRIRMELEKRGRSSDLDFFGARADELRGAVGKLGRGEDVYGIIHGDAHVGNVLYDGGAGFTIIDFELCAHGWFAYDLVPLLNTLIINLPSVAQRVWELILAGYEDMRRLSELERDAIPAFSQLWHLWDIGETLVISSVFGGRVDGLTALSSDAYLDRSLSTLRRLSAVELSVDGLFREPPKGSEPDAAP